MPEPLHASAHGAKRPMQGPEWRRAAENGGGEQIDKFHTICKLIANRDFAMLEKFRNFTAKPAVIFLIIWLIWIPFFRFFNINIFSFLIETLNVREDLFFYAVISMLIIFSIWKIKHVYNENDM